MRLVPTPHSFRSMSKPYIDLIFISSPSMSPPLPLILPWHGQCSLCLPERATRGDTALVAFVMTDPEKSPC